MKRFFRTHIRSAVVAACVVAIAAVGVGIAVASSGGTSSASATPTTTGPPTTVAPAKTGAHAGAKHKVPRVRATITTISATSWTVTTAKGKVLTVAIEPGTRFGTAKAPATAASYATGQSIVIVGQRHGTSLTATRIVTPPSGTPGSAGTPTTAAA